MDIIDEIWKARHPKDALFLQIFEGYTIKESKDYPNRIFYMKGDKLLIDYELKTKDAYINNKLIWSVFESNFSLNYEEIREILRGMLETYLNLMGTTPRNNIIARNSLLETHLNLKGTTPLIY